MSSVGMHTVWWDFMASISSLSAGRSGAERAKSSTPALTSDLDDRRIRLRRHALGGDAEVVERDLDDVGPVVGRGGCEGVDLLAGLVGTGRAVELMPDGGRGAALRGGEAVDGREDPRGIGE